MEDIFVQLYREVSPTVVTVRRKEEGFKFYYGTGFVLLSEERYSLIFTSSSIVKADQELFVCFGGDCSNIAEVLCFDPEEPFVILIVKNDGQRKSVTFSEDPASRAYTATIGAISNKGALGNFKGFVFTPSCAAFDESGQHLVGSEKYFLLKCTFEDEMEDFQDEMEDFEDEMEDFQDEMDDNTTKFHTADNLISAPIFGLNGMAVGIVASECESNDVKVGLHTKGIYCYLKRLAGGAEWKKLLKDRAKLFCNKDSPPEEKRTRKREHDDGSEGLKAQRHS